MAGPFNTVHPSTLDHSPKTLLRLAHVAQKLSHVTDDHFDDLQDISNLLMDWHAVRHGFRLVDMDGREYHIFPRSP
jgi:hypothetical protein